MTVAREEAPHVSARGISKRYGHVRALDEADFDLWREEVVALAGANGAGKSTLVKIISGLVTSDSGTVEVDGEPLGHGIDAARAAGIAVVHQELNLIPTASVAENILLWNLPRRGGFWRRAEIRERARAVLEEIGAEVDPDAIAGEITSVQQRLVMVASAMTQEASVLILDEPTAALPPDESRHVLDIARRLRSLGKVVVFVSHRLEEVREIADRTVVMRDGRVVEELVGEEIEVPRLIELIGGRRVAEADAAALEPAAEPPSRETLISVSGLSGPKVKPLDLEVRAGEILGVAGLIGSGRSELLRLLAGVQEPHGGEWARQGERIGYIGESRAHSVFHDFDVSGNLSLPSLDRFRQAGFVRRRAELQGTRAVMEQLRVKGRPSSPIWALSGGNQQKVLVGRWLMSGTQVLILDEPTIGIDVGARAEVHGLLRDAASEGRGVVVAIADPKELLDLCDRVIVLAEGALTLEVHAPFEEAQVVSASYAHDAQDSAA